MNRCVNKKAPAVAVTLCPGGCFRLPGRLASEGSGPRGSLRPCVTGRTVLHGRSGPRWRYSHLTLLSRSSSGGSTKDSIGRSRRRRLPSRLPKQLGLRPCPTGGSAEKVDNPSPGTLSLRLRGAFFDREQAPGLVVVDLEGGVGDAVALLEESLQLLAHPDPERGPWPGEARRRPP